MRNVISRERMGNRMDTLYLERFLIVAEQKSFTKAANQLFLSTSTVSKSVVYLGRAWESNCSTAPTSQ